jgi:hypothetical protein
MGGMYLLIPKAKTLQRARAEVFDQHISRGDQAPEEFLASGRTKIEGKAELVAVNRHECRRLAVVIRRTHPARVVATLWLLDLDHLRAQVSEQHGAVWP